MIEHALAVVLRSSGNRTFRSNVTMSREASSFALLRSQHVFGLAHSNQAGMSSQRLPQSFADRLAAPQTQFAMIAASALPLFCGSDLQVRHNDIAQSAFLCAAALAACISFSRTQIKLPAHANAWRKSSIKSSASSSPTETRTVPGSTLAARNSASDIL